MKKMMMLAVGLLVLPFMAAEASLKIGDSMPKISKSDDAMVGVDGKTYKLSELKGVHGTLVIFTCNHCPYSKAWEERYVNIGNKFKDDLAVIAINANDPADNPIDDMDGMKDKAKRLNMQYPYVVDSTSNVARAFDAEKTPEIFLFNKEGKLVYTGAVDDNHNAKKKKRDWLVDAIENLKAGKAIEPNSTRAIGCSIKFRPTANKNATKKDT